MPGESRPRAERPRRYTSEFLQGVAQGLALIGGADQAAALQRRNQTLGDLDDNPAAGPLERRADQEPVTTDRRHRLAHPLRHLVGGADEVEPAVIPLGSELAQGLAAAPLGEFVERPLLAI